MFPTQLRHGTVVSLGERSSDTRVFLGSEHLAALGWHLFERVIPEGHRSPVADILLDQPCSAQKSLAGNAMALPALAAFFLYILANTEKVAGDALSSSGSQQGASSDAEA